MFALSSAVHVVTNFFGAAEKDQNPTAQVQDDHASHPKSGIMAYQDHHGAAKSTAPVPGMEAVTAPPLDVAAPPLDKTVIAIDPKATDNALQNLQSTERNIDQDRAQLDKDKNQLDLDNKISRVEEADSKKIDPLPHLRAASSEARDSEPHSLAMKGQHHREPVDSMQAAIKAAQYGAVVPIPSEDEAHLIYRLRESVLRQNMPSEPSPGLESMETEERNYQEAKKPLSFSLKLNEGQRQKLHEIREFNARQAPDLESMETGEKSFVQAEQRKSPSGHKERGA
jgi:hypothetical protein